MEFILSLQLKLRPLIKLLVLLCIKSICCSNNAKAQFLLREYYQNLTFDLLAESIGDSLKVKFIYLKPDTNLIDTSYYQEIIFNKNSMPKNYLMHDPVSSITESYTMLNDKDYKVNGINSFISGAKFKYEKKFYFDLKGRLIETCMIEDNLKGKIDVIKYLYIYKFNRLIKVIENYNNGNDVIKKIKYHRDILIENVYSKGNKVSLGTYKYKFCLNENKKLKILNFYSKNDSLSLVNEKNKILVYRTHNKTKSIEYEFYLVNSRLVYIYDYQNGKLIHRIKLIYSKT